MSIILRGLGTASPAGSIAQADAAELAKSRCCTTDDQARLLPVLYRRTRVHRRGSVLLRAGGSAAAQQFFPPALAVEDHGPTTRERMERYAQEAAPLALDAARRALAEANLATSQISQLVTVTCTGFVAPGVDAALIKGLGLDAGVGRTQVGFMGCHGAFNGLRTVAAHLRADPSAAAMLVAVELCSLHFHYGWDPEKVVANALFADGAAAVVLTADTPYADAAAWRHAASGSCLFPDSEDAMTWIIGNHGFEMTLSSRVPDLIGSHLRAWLEPWLRGHSLTLDGVRSWAIHPGGPRIVTSVVESLGLDPRAAEASNQILAEHGNMSSPTILFILDHLRRAHAPRPCVALGFGPGLAAEAALFL